MVVEDVCALAGEMPRTPIPKEGKEIGGGWETEETGEPKSFVSGLSGITTHRLQRNHADHGFVRGATLVGIDATAHTLRLVEGPFLVDEGNEPHRALRRLVREPIGKSQ